jgi:hypothetical protein
MRKFTQKMVVLLAVMAAAGIMAGAASAQNLDLDEMAAALTLPVITGGQPPNTLKAAEGGEVVITGIDSQPEAITLNTVTNGRSYPVLLRVDVISGDPTGSNGGDRWQSDSFDCLLTGRETTTFLFVGDGDGSRVYVECSTPFGAGGLLADNKLLGLRAKNGVMFVAAASPGTGTAISEDLLFGDAVVVDLVQGQAYSFSAIPFQAGSGFNDGNKVYKFDGQEYARFPSVLATNFIAPDKALPSARINAELILFTLDGTTGNPTAPRVSVAGLGYNDDEVPFDFQWEFDCFDIVALQDMSANFAQDFLGSLSGHLQLVPQPVGTPGTDVHDAQFGDGNNSRRRPVHGWIVQNVLAGAVVVLGDVAPSPPGAPGQPTFSQPDDRAITGGPAAWGRPLAQGRGSLVPFLQDYSPVLNAGPF